MAFPGRRISNSAVSGVHGAPVRLAHSREQFIYYAVSYRVFSSDFPANNAPSPAQTGLWRFLDSTDSRSLSRFHDVFSSATLSDAHWRHAIRHTVPTLFLRRRFHPPFPHSRLPIPLSPLSLSLSLSSLSLAFFFLSSSLRPFELLSRFYAIVLLHLLRFSSAFSCLFARWLPAQPSSTQLPNRGVSFDLRPTRWGGDRSVHIFLEAATTYHGGASWGLKESVIRGSLVWETERYANLFNNWISQWNGKVWHDLVDKLFTHSWGI